jgi:hypothetical protein
MADFGGFSSEFGPGVPPPQPANPFGVTGTGATVLQNTPTLVAPNIGAATGSGLNLTVPGSATAEPIIALQPALGAGNSNVAAVFGAANSSRNGAYLGFNYNGGANALTNTVQLAVLGTNGITLDGNGLLTNYGNLNLTAGHTYQIGGTPLNFTNLAGSVAPAQLPNPAAAALGGVRSLAAVAHNFLTSISAIGQPVAAQPNTQDLSDRVAATAFTPTLSVSTLGDGVFSGVGAAGNYARIGMLVWFYLRVTFTLTFTTSSGTLSILGLPASVSGLSYVHYVVTPTPASPADHLLGTMNAASLVGEINGNNYIGNFFGPGLYGIVSGTQYTIHAGGVYLGAG